MDKQRAIELIGALSEANGAPGFEEEVVGVLQEALVGVGTITNGKMKNLYVSRAENGRGGRPVVMLDAHTDEVAFMVQHVLENGTLSFIPLGGWVPYCVPAHPVRVRTKGGSYIPGIIASKPPHFMSAKEGEETPAISDLVIDIGARGKAEAIDKYGVGVGSPAIPDVGFRFLDGPGLLYGKAFDCRLGCAALAATLIGLAGSDLALDVVGAFAAQEEVGMRGAKLSSAHVKPDAAIVFEGTPADDTFGDLQRSQTALYRGPMLRHIDSGMITSPAFLSYALRIAEECGIPAQEAVRSSGSTNGASIHLSAQGIPTIVIGLPVRYAHTHYCFSAYDDFENAVSLAIEILKGLDGDIISTF